MIVVLSFDDGRLDTYTKAFPIITNNNLTASVHITTGFIDGSFKTDEFGEGMKPIPVNALKEMFEYGIDISSHGDCHKMEPLDYSASIDKLKKWLTIDEKFGFSVPNSSATDDEIKDFLDKTSYEPIYVRVGRNKKCRSFLNKVRYVLYKTFHTQSSFNSFNKNNLIFNFDKYHINSLVVKSHTKAKNIIKFIEKHYNENCILVLMLHSITSKPNNEWEWNENEFSLLCGNIKNMGDNNLIRCANLKELVNEAK